MKRYRVLGFHFDSRAHSLEPVQEQWEPRVKEIHLQNQKQTETQLRQEFGEWAFEAKRENFVALGIKPFSVVAFHNRFLDQARVAFVVGAYYPALTAACALGERILNHLLLLLRDDFRSSEQYKKVYRKDSFDNWNLAITVLRSWGVLLPRAIQAVLALEKLRQQSLHFRPEVDTNDRALALKAIHQLEAFIREQFSGFGPQPWFIPDIPGASYIKKDAELWPFVKRIYLPNSHLVGPRHRLDFNGRHFIVLDDHDYTNTEISDDDFRALLNEGQGPEA